MRTQQNNSPCHNAQEFHGCLEDFQEDSSPHMGDQLKRLLPNFQAVVPQPQGSEKSRLAVL